MTKSPKLNVLVTEKVDAKNFTPTTELVVMRRGDEEVEELITSTLSILESDTIHSADLFNEGGNLNVLQTFLALTRKTHPEADVTHHRELLEEFGFGMDKVGNMVGYMSQEGKAYKTNPGDTKTVFMSHVDDASSGKSKPVQHVMSYDNKDDVLWIKTDGKTLLGGDDKAGMTVMLSMWTNKVPGFYVFFIGEESGGVGSRAANKTYNYKSFARAVSFDRHSRGSVITHQGGIRSCSDAFADALITDLSKSGIDFHKDEGGSFTDSKSFVDQIAECTNLSVGYFDYHGVREKVDADYLIAICDAYAKVDWEILPTDASLLVGVRPRRTYSNANYTQTWKRTTFDEVKIDADKGILSVDLISSYLRDNPAEASKKFYELLTGKEWIPYDIDGVAVIVGDVVCLPPSKLNYEVTKMTDYSAFLNPVGTVGSVSVGSSQWKQRGYKFVLSQVQEGIAENKPEVETDDLSERLYSGYREY